MTYEYCVRYLCLQIGEAAKSKNSLSIQILVRVIKGVEKWAFIVIHFCLSFSIANTRKDLIESRD